MSGQAVSRKLLLVFALQVACISFAVVCGVFVSAKVLEDSLIRRALEEEAELFASRLAVDASTPAPDTVNLKAYLTGRNEAEMPEAFRGLGPGFHKVRTDGRKTLVYVKALGDQELVLKFAQEQVLNLALYFGLVPLALVLLVVYGTTFVAYRLSRRTVSPIVGLARRVENLDLDHIDPAIFDPETIQAPNQEVLALANALQHLSARIQNMLERERAFTRDASHELRTPLTVVQMATDMLLDDRSLDDFQKRTLGRVRGAAREMQTMLEALLVLARADASHLPEKRFVVNDVVETEIERLRFLTQNRNVNVELRQHERMVITGVPSVLAILVGHVIRRVCSSAKGQLVTVEVGPGVIMVCADVEECNQAAPRHPKRECSSGETIVERLSRLFGWPVEIEDCEGRTFRAAIDLPHYEVEAAPGAVAESA